MNPRDEKEETKQGKNQQEQESEKPKRLVMQKMDSYGVELASPEDQP